MRRRAAGRDRLLEHGGLHRVDHREDELLAVGHGAQRRMRRPAYFSPLRRRPPASSHTRARDHERRRAAGRGWTGRPRPSASAFGVDRQRVRRLRRRAAGARGRTASARPGSRAPRTRGRRSPRPTIRSSGRRPIPPRPARRAPGRRPAARRAAAGGPRRRGPRGGRRSRAPSTRTSTPSRNGHSSRKLKSVPLKSMPDVSRRERAGEQHREERPDPDRGRQSGALEEVEDEVHAR